MSRRYDEQVEVRVGETVLAGAPPAREGVDGAEAPTAFVWRGRLHVVRAVLDHWTQRRPWWRLAWSDEPGRGGTDLEQQVWRVEACAGRSGPTGVYELSKDVQWRLVRVSD